MFRVSDLFKKKLFKVFNHHLFICYARFYTKLFLNENYDYNLSGHFFPHVLVLDISKEIFMFSQDFINALVFIIILTTQTFAKILKYIYRKHLKEYNYSTGFCAQYVYSLLSVSKIFFENSTQI